MNNAAFFVLLFVPLAAVLCSPLGGGEGPSLPT